MFGFIIGAASLVGLIWMLSHGGWHGRGGFGARRAALRAFLRRLDATPSQEKLIRTKADELSMSLRSRRQELWATRGELAQAVNAERLDRERLQATFIRHDELLNGARQEFVEALASVHETLDARQRDILARLIERGRVRDLLHGDHAGGCRYVGPRCEHACSEVV
jgi:Spy/CpxP family protein refolding chaperone